ncbi:MAG: hypothetical protein H6654_19070 [Ardenticatenaceae bacterium]|nr:hypothetical protein [Anaerolineales bacterium]MCB8938303.1 hypothetical protein [Ardenticatenaceae bacterium]MCB8975668.1 hypothetical protein [Ardenticatenaceae bacterium]
MTPPPRRRPGRRPPPIWRRLSSAGWLLFSLVIGLIGGLYYAWVVDPVVFTDASPARFSESYREEYIILVSQSYAVNENWPLAQQRLAELEEPNIGETVNELLETAVRQNRPAPLLEQLAVVARNLGAQGQAVALFAPTLPANNIQPTPTSAIATTPTNTPPPAATATNTAVPTLTPTATTPATATPQPSYRLTEQTRLCDDEQAITRIEVIVLDAFLNDAPGIEVEVTWQNGSDRFFTGFKPENGRGYADFEMSPDISYTVRLPDGSPEVSGLRIEECASGFSGGWQLTFQNLRN